MAGSHPLVGREAESEALEHALDGLERRRGGAILQVAGEPGIGKSRLLAELCASAEGRGHLVLTGRASEFERDLPFGVFIAALDDYLASLERDLLERVGSATINELATAFPALVPLAAPGDVALGDERYRTYRAVRAMLDGLAEARPLVVALDDVHWADPASAELIVHLMAHPPRRQVLVILAFRPAQVPEKVGLALSAAARDGTAGRIELGPLSRDEVHRLVGDHVDRSGLEALFRESGGNPFYLEQLLKRARPTQPQDVGLAGDGTPSAIADALAEELSSLPPASRTLAEAAAVAGDPFDAELAAAVAGVEETQAWQALEVLVGRDVVRPTAVPRRFRFRHPIVRRAVYDRSTLSWRLAAHARAADALRKGGSPAAAFAHHIERSARVGDEEASGLLVEAAEATMTRAPATAARWYEAALRLLPDGEAFTTRRLDLLIATATAMAGAGRLADSRDVLADVLGRPLPVALRVRLGTWAAALESHVGQAGEARNRLLRLLGDLEDPESAEAANLCVGLSEAFAAAGDYVEAVPWARRALDTARILGATALCATAAANLALAEHGTGRIPAARRDLDEAVTALDDLGDATVAPHRLEGSDAERLHATFSVVLVEAYFAERFDDAIAHAERGVRLCRVTGQGQLLLPLLLGQAWATAARGMLGPAAELAGEAVEANRVTGNAYGLMASLWVLSRVATQAGDLETAVAAGEEAVALTRTIDAGVFTAVCGVAWGCALVEVGQAALARDAVLANAGGGSLPELSRFQRCDAYAVLGTAELALDNVEAAASWAGRAADLVSDGGLSLETATARQLQAAVLLAQREYGAAAATALAAAEDAGRAGARVEAARAALLAGRALALAGSRTEGIVELRRAWAELDACGARRYRDLAGAELDRLDRSRSRTRAAGSVGMKGLTDREREIAELIGHGLTNRQIAARCYLSEKTVERHVTHVFDKLGVSTRTAVAALVASAPSDRPDQA